MPVFKRFCKNKKIKDGFTLIELLVVISIIGLLSSIVITSVSAIKEKAYLARVKEETRNIALALEFYADKYGEYPADANRAVPPGVEEFLEGGVFPPAPWPGSVYDWDNWSDLDYAGQKIYQISIRFCPSYASPLSDCNFPNEPWTASFDQYSAVYYCIFGACRSHSIRPVTHPGHCLNC
jgi:prepilin-type N-terminal cleavage/methylation domain-containing protein